MQIVIILHFAFYFVVSLEVHYDIYITVNKSVPQKKLCLSLIKEFSSL